MEEAPGAHLSLRKGNCCSTAAELQFLLYVSLPELRLTQNLVFQSFSLFRLFRRPLERPSDSTHWQARTATGGNRTEAWDARLSNSAHPAIGRVGHVVSLKGHWSWEFVKGLSNIAHDGHKIRLKASETKKESSSLRAHHFPRCKASENVEVQPTQLQPGCFTLAAQE